jgi:5-(carboxyamino)imidazole ribonucleotide mutase
VHHRRRRWRGPPARHDAAKTTLPVLGVPVQSKALNGIDSLLSIVQMPARACRWRRSRSASAGATNAALFAAAILALQQSGGRQRAQGFRQSQTEAVLAQPDPRKAP